MNGTGRRQQRQLHHHHHHHQSQSPSRSPPSSENRRHSQKPKSPESRRKQPAESVHSRYSDIPTPPTSASPTSSSFHPSNPFSRNQPSSPLASPAESPSGAHSPPGNTQKPLGRTSSHRRYPPVTSIGRSASRASASASVGASGSQPQPSGRPHHRSRSVDSPHGSTRPGNLNARFPGDLSHRPLEMIKQHTRTANRSGGSRHRRNVSDVDTIDALDTIGGMYHHGGPYDPTLASRNVNVKYPPVDAVHEGNMEAIRATPREYIQDSLVRHMPLQGIATIPPGETDMSGNVMDFEEGADLMRESDAGGGPYKRWDGIKYHPDDLKGKGEPSYTYDKEKAKGKGLQRGEYEMQSGVNGDGLLGPAPLLRSVSNSDKRYTTSTAVVADESSASGVRRSNTTGKKLSEGLKRRFGSIRRKRDSTSVEQTY
ncbi:hypothetical protein HJFPF1_04721 [Paramyrothecium foliicola]|nr:hypothetical protein HJFPF1_04721 [Paramyrothecium foliicola]